MSDGNIAQLNRLAQAHFRGDIFKGWGLGREARGWCGWMREQESGLFLLPRMEAKDRKPVIFVRYAKCLWG